MKRYHEEKHLFEQRAKMRQHLDRAIGAHSHDIEPGRFRKALRCGGCGRARCQVCHSEKFPKRTLTRKEQQAFYDFQDYKRDGDAA
jgi:hypothetical protein